MTKRENDAPNPTAFQNEKESSEESMEHILASIREIMETPHLRPETEDTPNKVYIAVSMEEKSATIPASPQSDKKIHAPMDSDVLLLKKKRPADEPDVAEKKTKREDRLYQHDKKSESSLEYLVADALSPLIQAWLQEHLPYLVEKVVREEIAKLFKNKKNPN